MAAHYFAYVTRQSDRLYRAELVDLPACEVPPCRLTLLSEHVVEAVRAFLDGRCTPLPSPTRLHDLPKRSNDGFWMAFDVTTAVKAFPYGVEP